MYSIISITKDIVEWLARTLAKKGTKFGLLPLRKSIHLIMHIDESITTRLSFES